MKKKNQPPTPNSYPLAPIPMPLIPWSPSELFESLERAGGLMPAVDIYETDKTVIVESPVPGVDADNIEVTIDQGVLTISGKDEKKTEVEEKNYYRKEVRHGSFSRSVVLPVPVIAEKADAEIKKGILYVEIPKAEEPKASGVKVNVKKSKS